MKLVQAGILVLVGALGALLIVKTKGGPEAPAPAPEVLAAPAAAVAAVPAPVAAPPERAPVSAAPVEARKPAAVKSAAAKKPIPAPVAASQPTPSVEVAAAAKPAPAPPPVPPPAPEPVAAREPEPPAPPLPPPPPPLRKVTIPAGTLIPVRLIETVSSDKSRLGDRFNASLDSELVVDGFVIAEKGARLEGRVADTQAAGRVKGVSALSLELTSLATSDGQRIEISTDTFTKQGDKSKGSDAAKIGGAAAIGAAIGAIAGGGKGAAIGAGVGGAAGTGGVLGTRGKPSVLPSETRLSFRLNSAVTITERRRGR